LVASTEDIKPYFAPGLTVEIIRLFFYPSWFSTMSMSLLGKKNTSNEVDHLPNLEYVIKPRIPYNLMKLGKYAEHFREKANQIKTTYCILLAFVL
jgi:hypothetical protein